MMHWLALGLALLLAFGIIAIGIGYLARPMTMTRNFGLPLPEDTANIASWLRLKGIRDIASGLTVLAFLAADVPRGVGLVLLAEAVIPVGDMFVILAAKGSRSHAFGMHGLTAAIMMLAALTLLLGAA